MRAILSSNTQNEGQLSSKQFSTFMIDGRLYGVDVMKVQEVTKPLQVTLMRTAPKFVKGLINLRGQIATAIGLREIFGLPEEHSLDKMTVVCRVEDTLISILVDEIGDVVEVEDKNFEATPQTIPTEIRFFMKGVYKTENHILSVLDLDLIVKELDKRCAA